MSHHEGAFADYIIYMCFMAVHCGSEAALLGEMGDLRFHIVLFVC